jgi:hypothetical protein
MGYPTKVQRIKRKESEQWYINFPSAVAHAMEFVQSEVVEWIIEDKQHLLLRRTNPPPSAMKKKRRPDSSPASKTSLPKPREPSDKKKSGKGQRLSP